MKLIASALVAFVISLSAAQLPAQVSTFPQTFDVPSQGSNFRFADNYVFQEGTGLVLRTGDLHIGGMETIREVAELVPPVVREKKAGQQARVGEWSAQGRF